VVTQKEQNGNSDTTINGKKFSTAPKKILPRAQREILEKKSREIPVEKPKEENITGTDVSISSSEIVQQNVTEPSTLTSPETESTA